MKTIFILSLVATVGLFAVFWVLPYMVKPEFTDLSLDVPFETVKEKAVPLKKPPFPQDKKPKSAEKSSKSIPSEKSREGAVPLAPVTTESLSYEKIKGEIKDLLDMAGKASPLVTIGIAWWSKKKNKGKKKKRRSKNET